MKFLHIILADVGRIGVGVTFLLYIVVDIMMRPQIFKLMQVKRIPSPWLCYFAAIVWKFSTSMGLILNKHTFLSALLLALYVFIANHLFNNFWSMPADRRSLAIPMYLIHLAVCFGLLAVAACWS